MGLHCGVLPSHNCVEKKIPFHPSFETVCSHIEAHGLETEGLFRINGNSKTQEKLRIEYEKGIPVDLEELGVDMNSAAGMTCLIFGNCIVMSVSFLIPSTG
jgi:hypothetical protein